MHTWHEKKVTTQMHTTYMREGAHKQLAQVIKHQHNLYYMDGFLKNKKTKLCTCMYGRIKIWTPSSLSLFLDACQEKLMSYLTHSVKKSISCLGESGRWCMGKRHPYKTTVMSDDEQWPMGMLLPLQFPTFVAICSTETWENADSQIRVSSVAVFW